MVQRTKKETSTYEIWKPVVGYEDLYQVSNLGRVRSLDRISSNGSRRKGRLLTPTGLDYVHVTLSRAGVKKQPYVHTLVLNAFCGLPKPGQIGCHKNDIPTDNRLVNLYWGTPSDNYYDAVRNGGIKNFKLCPARVREIRKLHNSGLSTRKLAARFSVSQSNIHQIISRRIWDDVK